MEHLSKALKDLKVFAHILLPVTKMFQKYDLKTRESKIAEAVEFK